MPKINSVMAPSTLTREDRCALFISQHPLLWAIEGVCLCGGLMFSYLLINFFEPDPEGIVNAVTWTCSGLLVFILLNIEIFCRRAKKIKMDQQLDQGGVQ